jgi:hypothetical protein
LSFHYTFILDKIVIEGTNLDTVWDTDIIEDENITLDDCMALYKQLSPVQKANIRNTDFVGCLNQNRKLLDNIYPPIIKLTSEIIRVEVLAS